MDDDLDVAVDLLGIGGYADDGGEPPEGELALAAEILQLPAPRVSYEQRSGQLMQRARDKRALQRAEAQQRETKDKLDTLTGRLSWQLVLCGFCFPGAGTPCKPILRRHSTPTDLLICISPPRC